MKSKLIFSVAIITILSFFDASAAESGPEGNVTLTGTMSNLAGNEAKFNEYRDIRDGAGLYSRIRLHYDKEKYFMNFKTDDIGYDTQEYRWSGGLWGKLGAYLEYNEIPHNFTFDARSFYSGAGGNNLTYPVHPPSTDVSSWDEFDYSIERKRFGGGFNLRMLKPFYVDVSASREKRDGIFPVGVGGTTPGGIAIELPEPIDYTTDMVKFETGYAKNPLFLSLGFYYSIFENNHNSLFFRNPATANTASATDFFSVSPDNDYYKLALKGSYRLPFRSRFLVNLASSRTRSEANLLSYRIDDVAGGVVPITLGYPKFDGKVDTQNYALVLSSNPISFLDGRLSYKHYKTVNKSDEITTTDGAEIYVNHLFDYKKDTLGVELGFRLPANFYLTTAYKYIKTRREREDIAENKDDRISAELRWSGLDFMVPRVGFEGLYRDAKFEGPTSPDDIESFIRRFDAAAKNRNAYKASVDVAPIDNLNFSIGYEYKKTDYQDLTLGFQDEKSDQFSFDGDYTFKQILKLFGYFMYERIKTSQFHRQFTPADSPNPATLPTASAFNWDVTQRDREYDYGIGADIYVIPRKLSFTVQHDYVRSNGSTDFTYYLDPNPLPAGRTQDNIDILSWDDYRLQTYRVKATYEVTKRFSFIIGYAYERFKFQDAQVEGYQYVPATTGTNGAYLTGAYSDPSYSGSVVFLGVNYKF